MSALGGILHAFAWMAWAIPISLPSSVIQELRLMFCALKGATLWPCSAKMRHRAVTTMLLPTCEPVPSTISGFAVGFIVFYPVLVDSDTVPKSVILLTPTFGKICVRIYTDL